MPVSNDPTTETHQSESDLSSSLTVIKYGGNAMTDSTIRVKLIKQVKALYDTGVKLVIVHGGGPYIKDTLELAGIDSRFIEGQRQTTSEAMPFVEMALRGRVNGDLVRLLNAEGIPAVGLSGKDGMMATVQKRKLDGDSDEDLGQVGDVDKIDPELIHLLLEKGYLPVVAPIGLGTDGKDYNVNADLFAGHLAAAIESKRFVVLTDVDGLLREPEDPQSLISRMNLDDIEAQMHQSIRGGMIPKIESCRVAVESGVDQALILNGKKPERLMDALVRNKPQGTTISQ